MALPSNVSFGTVVGRFMRAVADGPDAGRDPDGIPFAGLTVKFIPTADRFKNITAVPPVTIVADPITATTDAEGYLIDPQGERGVRLLATDDEDLSPTGWTWGVAISGTGFRTLTFNFALPTDGEIDLATVVPVPGNPGQAMQDWLAAVAASEAAATSAGESAGIAVAAAVDAVAAKDAAEAVPAQVDTAMAPILADPESTSGAVLRDTFARFGQPPVPPFLRAGVAQAYAFDGDSLSAQGGGIGIAPGNFLQVLTGLPVNLNAVGGETYAGIMARMNVAPLMMSPEGGQIPASGEVVVTFTSPTGETVWPLLQTAGNPAIGKVWVGTLMGVHGTFSLVQPSGASASHRADDYYLFTRTAPGAAVTVPRAAAFIIDYAATHAGMFHILWPGRNNMASSDRDVDRMLVEFDLIAQKIIAEGGDFLVLGILNGAGEGTGTTIHTAILDYSARLQARYPERYVPIREELIARGLAMAGITPTTQDQADIAADIVPDSLRTDSVHLEVVAREVVANIVHEYLLAFGRQDAPAIGFFDGFNRADSASLGAGWDTGHDYQIVSNQLTRVGTSTTPAILAASIDLGSSDMEVAVDVVTRGGSSSTGLLVRYVDANNYIAARINGTGNVLLYKVIAGVTTSLIGADGLWTSDPARLTLRVIGNTITALRDSVQIIAFTGAVPEVAAAHRVAIRTASAATKPVLDNFEARSM